MFCTVAAESALAAREMFFVAARDNAARVDAVRAVFATRGVAVPTARVTALRDVVAAPVRDVIGCDAVRA